MIADAISAMLPQRHAGTPMGPEDDFWYYPVGMPSSSGVNVDEQNALTVSAVYGCIRVLRESLSSLPWRVYRQVDDREKERAEDHYLWRILHDRPNPWMTPAEFKELGVTHLCLRGNYYSEIRGAGDNITLHPLNPDNVATDFDVDTGLITYEYRRQDGRIERFSHEQIFHVRGMSLNSVVGCSVIEYARNVIGAALAQEDHGSSLFRNGGLPAFWISRPAERKWTQTARDNFRKEWKAIHAGSENAGQPPILGDGMKIHELGLTNRDSQWLESREFSAEEICRFFGVAPYMIGVKTSAPLGSIEQQSLEFATYTLGPLAVRFEQAANRDLVDEPDNYYTKIILDALVRANIESRYSAHNVAVQGGWKTINEVRETEDLNPIEGGDEPRFPMNMLPAGGGPDFDEQGGDPGKEPIQTPPPQEKEAAADPPKLTAYEKWKVAAEEARPAFEVLLVATGSRLAAVEINGLATRAKKARADRDRWDEWASEFYAKHRSHAIKAVAPLCEAWRTQTGGSNEPEAVADYLLLATGEIYNPDRDPADVLAEWRQTRADEIGNRLCNLFFGETK